MKNNNKNKHTYDISITNELIKYLPPEEKLTSSDILSTMKKITTNDIIENTLLNEVNFSVPHHIDQKITNNMQKYFFPLPKHKTRSYHPDLENVREHMEEANENNENAATLEDIEYIIKNYQHLLSFDDAIHLYFILISIKLEKYTQENNLHIDQALLLLQHLYPYEKQFSFQQKDYFWHNMGLSYYCKAHLGKGKKTYTQLLNEYQKAIAAFDKVLNTNRMHTKDLLDEKTYKEALYYKIFSLHELNSTYANKKKLPIIREFLQACCGTTSPKECENNEYKQRIVDVLYIQGSTYEKLYFYDKAIESYKNYLFLNPDDKFVQKNIEYLQSKISKK